jgi:hypothetical protein
MTTVLGLLVVAAGGLLMGSGAWPFKLMRKYQFEHWWFVGMLVGLIIMLCSRCGRYPSTR